MIDARTTHATALQEKDTKIEDLKGASHGCGGWLPHTAA